MNPRQFLRAMKHLLGEFIPWQLVATVRGRDYDATILPVEVEPHPPVAPSAGFNLIDLITEVLTDHGISYGECLAPVIAEALEASLAARLAPPK